MIEIDDLISVDGIDYVVLDKIPYDGVDYFFVNRVLEDETNTTDFYFMKVENGLMVKVIDNQILDILGPIVSTNMQKKIDEVKAGE